MARHRRGIAPEKKLVWHVAFYIRLSKDDGNDESLSVGNQRKILLEYVHKNFDKGFNIVDFYIDDGKTGTNVNRPDFMRMERDIQDGKVNCVIVKSLARAFRNLGDQQKYLEEFFPLHGVRFINLGNPFIDTYTNPRSISGLEVPIYGMFNEQFAASTSEEVRKTFNTKRRRGEFIGAFAPYGYKKDPENKNRLIIDEEAAQTVRDIFNWFLYGIEGPGEDNRESLSINGIARKLNERGVPCPASYKQLRGYNYHNPHNRFKHCYWSGSSVSRMLKDRVYTGCMVQGRFRVISYKIHKQIKTSEEEWFVVEGKHEHIIDPVLFDEVQRRLEHDTRTAAGKNEVYLFSGFLRCAACGRSLHRRTSKNYVYYYCRSKQLSGTACGSRAIRLDILEAIVINALNAQIDMIDNLSGIVEQISHSPRIDKGANRLSTMLKQHESEHARLTRISDTLYVDWKNGDITREDYLRMKSGFACRLEEIAAAVTKIREDCDEIASGFTTDHPYFLEFQKHRRFTSLRRDMLIALIDTILLHEHGGVTIRFRYCCA